MDKQKLEIYAKESIDKIYDAIMAWHYPEMLAETLHDEDFKNVIEKIIIGAFDDSREDIAATKVAIAEIIKDSLPFIPYNTVARIENAIALTIDKNFDFFAKFFDKEGCFSKMGFFVDYFKADKEKGTIQIILGLIPPSGDNGAYVLKDFTCDLRYFTDEDFLNEKIKKAKRRRK